MPRPYWTGPSALYCMFTRIITTLLLLVSRNSTSSSSNSQFWNKVSFLPSRPVTTAAAEALFVSTLTASTRYHPHPQCHQYYPTFVNNNQNRRAATAPITSLGSIIHRPSFPVLFATRRIRNNNNNNHTMDPPASGPNHTTSSSRMASSSVVAEPPVSIQPDTVFPEEILEYDHYRGVTIHWNDSSAKLLLQQQQQPSTPDETIDIHDRFVPTLQHQLALWKANGTRGVWMHVDPSQASVVPLAMQQGFEFHMVLHPDKTLILSQWLPTRTPSRLPHPPSHQIGVGCLVWHPQDINNNHDDDDDDDNRRMLVVQEKTGPAAQLGLWKMPTGLADPSEDIPDAAIRELYEETGLEATFDGMVGFRQAHSTPPATTTTRKKWGGVSRKASDLFFVCQLSLKNTTTNTTSSGSTSPQIPQWTACPQEIAAIQWMKVSEYCQQERWQFSPLYQQFNQVIRHAAQYHLWEYHTLPLRNDDPHGYMNTLYHSKKMSPSEQQQMTTTSSEEDAGENASDSKL